MDRRRFLKLGGLSSLGALSVVMFPHAVFGSHRSEPVASRSGRLYSADRRGRIFVSEDGHTWKVHTNLGRDYWVRRLDHDQRGRVMARVSYRSREFGLVLDKHERSWRTH
jgi:hypothetical protein